MSKKVDNSGFEYSIALKTKNGENLPLDTITRSEVVSGIRLCVNGKMEMYIGTSDKIYRHLAIRNSETAISDLENTEELVLVAESAIIKHIKLIGKDTTQEYAKLLEKMVVCGKTGQLVPIPRWADYVIRKIKNERNLSLYNAVMSSIMNGKIYTGTLIQLLPFKNQTV